MSRQLTADQSNEFLEIGRLIDESTFSKEKKKIFIPDLNAMIDLILKEDGILFVAEIKKSVKTLNSGILQLKYYLYLLEKKKVKANGVIKIPREKKSVIVELNNDDRKFIEEQLVKLNEIIKSEKPPKAKKIKFCSKCAHFDFCWS
ncbi:CRISPR-associated protein Cas4 [Thermotomaculum hydrothermale]|uniref:CRISPR-associated exonuclease Cas4 n=1 Tax=Thermotomaculum hydrothermale TaxID=981385 RepID=A0A7R6SXT0_9BACT|nr:CRISPR-associated protein Cas4 [Thermotomaculum hydrothermale]